MTHLMTIRAGVGVGSNAKWHAFTKMTSEHSVVNDLTEHAKIKIKEKNMSVRLRMTSVHAFASQSEEGDAFEIDLSGLNAQVTQLAALGLFHVKVMFVNTAAGDADQVLERPVPPPPLPWRQHVRRQPPLRRGNRRLPRRRRRAARARAAPPPRRGRGLSAREPRESPRANGTLRRARPRTLV